MISHPDRKVHLAIAPLLQWLGRLDASAPQAPKDYPFVLAAGQRRMFNANQIFRDPAWRRDDPDGALLISTRDLEEQGEAVQDVFKQWTAKQNSLPNPQSIPLVRILYNGKSLRVNCLNGDGIADLRAAILKTAADTQGFREPLPKPWLDLREAMRALQTTRKFITWNEYKERALTCGITEDRLLAATSFLHGTLEIRDFGLSARRRQLEDLEDFLACVLSQAVEGDKMQDVRALFDKIDADGSGAIDRDELRAFAQTHGLGNASIDLLMRSADDDESGEIEFEEFRKRFELAQSAAQSNVLLNLIYLNLEWMIDVVKGVVRHDTAALLQFLQDTGEMELQHLARRMRVQGIVAQELIDEFLFWPGNPDSAFWSKVEVEGGGETTSFTYERSLWLDGAKNLKKVVESAEDTRAALGLLLGFKILLRINAKELYCADIVPKHTKDMIHGVSLDSVHCAYWMIRRYLRLPSGFWDTLYMELRSLATSGSNSTHIQTVFLLSAKIQIMQTQGDDGRIRIDARASTRAAFEVAQNALATVAKYYRGMALWEVSTERISAEDSAEIVEPAQVLVMTAASFVLCKTADAIQSFNTAVSNVDGAPGLVKQAFIEAARARFAVGGIVDKRKVEGQAHLLVRWKGFDASSDTWESRAKMMRVVPDMVKKFELELAKRLRKQNRAEKNKRLVGYMLFSQHYRTAATKVVGKDIRTITKGLGGMWNALPEEDKATWKAGKVIKSTASQREAWARSWSQTNPHVQEGDVPVQAVEAAGAAGAGSAVVGEE